MTSPVIDVMLQCIAAEASLTSAPHARTRLLLSAIVGAQITCLTDFKHFFILIQCFILMNQYFIFLFKIISGAQPHLFMDAPVYAPCLLCCNVGKLEWNRYNHIRKIN